MVTTSQSKYAQQKKEAQLGGRLKPPPPLHHLVIFSQIVGLSLPKTFEFVAVTLASLVLELELCHTCG